MMKQKDAVFAAITLAATNGLEGDSAHDFAVEQVKIGLMTGEVEHSKGQLDEKAAKSYAGSLISNWKKKDKRLNGGVDYTPTTKRGPQVKDERLKELNDNLKALKAHSADMTIITRVESAIEARRAELSAEKAASKVQSLDETLASLQALGIDV